MLGFWDREGELFGDAAADLPYEDRKRGLASQHRLDREAYTQAKSPFIARCLDDASRRARV